MTDCLFCNIASEDKILETRNLFVLKDRYPVTEGHLLVIPKMHRADVFEMSAEEIKELTELLPRLKQMLLREDKSVDGFNIGANCGSSAGQTIFHCHIHFIPRRSGDMPDPRGGVRAVIPEKQKY